MKGISYCLIRRKLEPLHVIGIGLAWYPRAVICVLLCWVWHLYNLPCVSVLFGLISIARFVFKSPSICFWGTKYDIYCERVAYSPPCLCPSEGHKHGVSIQSSINLGDALLQITRDWTNSRDLILGEVVYISIIYRIQDSSIHSLNDYDFSFDHMTGENRELKSWCMKTDQSSTATKTLSRTHFVNRNFYSGFRMKAWVVKCKPFSVQPLRTRLFSVAKSEVMVQNCEES